MDDILFSVLSCPVCKKTLIKDKYGVFLYCEYCDLEFPITEGIPDLRIEKKPKELSTNSKIHKSNTKKS